MKLSAGKREQKSKGNFFAAKQSKSQRLKMATDVSTLLKTTYNETTAASELQMLKEIFNSIDLLGSSRAQKIQQLKQDIEGII
jgi:hypothetical protein